MYKLAPVVKQQSCPNVKQNFCEFFVTKFQSTREMRISK